MILGNQEFHQESFLATLSVEEGAELSQPLLT